MVLNGSGSKIVEVEKLVQTKGNSAFIMIGNRDRELKIRFKGSSG